jgi:hypothetical protein
MPKGLLTGFLAPSSPALLPRGEGGNTLSPRERVLSATKRVREIKNYIF